MTRWGQGAEAVAFGDPDPEPQAQGALRASSVTPQPPVPRELPPRVVPTAVTVSDFRERAERNAARITSTVSAVLAGQHLTGQLKSLTDARHRVHDAASTHEGWVPKYGRVLYGYLFLLVKSCLNLLEVTLEEPLRAFTVALVLILFIVFH